MKGPHHLLLRNIQSKEIASEGLERWLMQERMEKIN